MGIDEKLAALIVERVLSVLPVERIILFGSAASGHMNKDSDVDLLVLGRNVANAREESVRIRGHLRGLGYPFDVIVMSLERFEETKNVIGGIAYPANKEGKVIYAAA